MKKNNKKTKKKGKCGVEEFILEDNLAPGEIILLYWLQNKNTSSTFPQYFQSNYEINPTISTDKLIHLGYVSLVGAFESLNTFAVSQLNEIAESHKLPPSNNKKKIIRNICDNLNPSDLLSTNNIKGYKLDDKASNLLEKYKLLIWCHKYDSKDGTVNVNKVVSYLSDHREPWEIALELQRIQFNNNIADFHFGMATSNIRYIANLYSREHIYEKSLLNYLRVFIFDISGVYNYYSKNDIVLYLDIRFNPNLSNNIKRCIKTLNLTNIELESYLINAWEISTLLPATIVKRFEDMKLLLFASIEEDKKNFEIIMTQLYDNIPENLKPSTYEI